MANTTDYKHVKGIADLSAVLQALPADMRSHVLADGVRESIQPIKVAAKRFAKRSERTGATRESITEKVVNYPNNGVAVGLVGPDRAYYRGRRKVGKLGALYGADRPANTFHLVEYGHHIVAPKKGTSRRKGTAVAPRSGKTWVPAKPIIRPAVLTTTTAQGDGFYKGVARGYEATRRRMVKAGTHAV